LLAGVNRGFTSGLIVSIGDYQMTQHQILARLLKRKLGCTSVEICDALPSVSPHRRLSDMKDQGWIITKKKDGKLFRYFGTPPKTFS
jgi:hypothetical protein